MTPNAIAQANKRLKHLRALDAKRQAARKEKLTDWFNRFDLNQDQMLQRDELRELLTHLQPQAPPTEANLDFLIVHATRIESSSLSLPGNKNGSVPWNDAMETVLLYTDYVKEQTFIDAIFDEFDDDNSGTLDPSELPGLLAKCAPEGYICTSMDVDYVMSLCDVNRNNLIDRDEVKPLIARWKSLSAERMEEQAAEPPDLMTRIRTSKALDAISNTGDVAQKVSLRLAGKLSAARNRVQVADGGSSAADPAAAAPAAASAAPNAPTPTPTLSEPSVPVAADKPPAGGFWSLFCCASPPPATPPPDSTRAEAKAKEAL